MADELSKYVIEVNDAFEIASRKGFKTTEESVSIDFILGLATKLKVADVSAEKLRSDADV